MMLHGGRTMARLKGRPQKKKSAEEPTEALARRNRRKAGGIANGGGNFRGGGTETQVLRDRLAPEKGESAQGNPA
jgi:hypothetical protein